MAQVRPLNKILQEVAIAELNEVPERIPADIEALRTWIKQQPHLRSRNDDQFLLAFLRGCKFSLEKAKSKIDKFNAFRSKYPHMFRCTDVDEPKVRELLHLGVMFYLPTPLNDHGPRIVMMRNGVYSPDDYSVEDISRAITTMQEIAMIEDDYANVNGICFIMDMTNCTAGHLLQMTPGDMKKMSVYSEDGVPLRPRASHFIHTPSGFEPFFKLVKPMMSQKQQNRLYVHGNKLELLYEHVPQKYLPKEYGGENGSIAEITATWNKKLDEHRAYFKDNDNYGTVENLRPGKPIDLDDVFGIDGSFRKLNVD